MLEHNLHTFIRKKIPKIKDICARCAVDSLSVFGSAAKGTFHKESDVDFLVQFCQIPLENYAENYFDFVESLEQLLKRPVDLVTEKYMSNPYFIKSVTENKILIYSMNEETEKLLNDILISILSIDEYIGEKKDFSVFQKQKLFRRAVERELEIIGEAVNKLSKINPELKISDAAIIVGLRNRIIHAYDAIDNELIWAVVIKHLPNLKTSIVSLLEE